MNNLYKRHEWRTTKRSILPTDTQSPNPPIVFNDFPINLPFADISANKQINRGKMSGLTMRVWTLLPILISIVSSHKITKYNNLNNDLVFFLKNLNHSSEKRGLCLMNWSSETLQNLPYFWNTKTYIVFFVFHFVLLSFFLMNALVCVEIDKDNY